MRACLRYRGKFEEVEQEAVRDCSSNLKKEGHAYRNQCTGENEGEENAAGQFARS